MTQPIMIVAGEVSGDIHAGNLMREMPAVLPDASAFGVGGENLAAAGMEILVETGELAHMGLVEVLRELPRLRGIMDRLVAAAADRRPGVAVLVDSPDFNLRLARRLKAIGIPVVLYVSPQLWAWRRGRVNVVKELAHEVLCILPFEVDFYAEHGVPARYVGHPLLDDFARSGLGGDPVPGSPEVLALLPGSRPMEVRTLLPAMLDALARLGRDEVREARLVEAPGIGPVVDEALGGIRTDPRLIRCRGASRRQALAECGRAWTASGTATLECALLDVPMIVGYRLARVSWWLARALVRVPHVALVNLIADERAAPEILQHAWTGERLAAATRDLTGEALDRQRTALVRVRERLGHAGASRSAAEAVASVLQSAQ
jgi:lipid-A-disaccharide synthase